jgi:hypothetical protein
MNKRGATNMKSTALNLTRLAGIPALLAGVSYVIVGLFHPPHIASSATTTSWQLVHIAACAMAFLGLLGMAGLYARQAPKVGRLGLVGYILLSLWFALVLGFSFVEAFIVPQMASTSPEFVEAWMGMFAGPGGDFDLGVLPTLWGLSAPLLILGGLLFGVATFRARILPRLAGLLLAFSTVVAPVAGLLPNEAQPKIAIPMGIALVWLGYSLMAERRTESVAPLGRELVER